MTVYPVDRLYEEVAFVAYHFNWSREAVLGMPHRERQRWCEEISAINERINEESQPSGGPGGPGGPGTGDSGGAPTLEQEIPDEFFEEEEDDSWLE
ncbi:MAG: DUF6760 family protein [Haloarculaceae archaeon]